MFVYITSSVTVPFSSYRSKNIGGAVFLTEDRLGISRKYEIPFAHRKEIPSQKRLILAKKQQ